MFNFYMLILCSHLVEHVLQVVQIYILGWPPEISGGLLGLFYPQLIHNETLHFLFAAFHLAGLLYFRNLFKGSLWWTIAIAIQGFHFGEHIQLMLMYLNNMPMELRITHWHKVSGLSRPLLHLFYNLIAMAPIVMALKNRSIPKPKL